jgi:hypothetical protein
MTEALGCRRWVIAEGYLPSDNREPAPPTVSHETACVLNTSAQDAHLTLTIFYTNREPVGPYTVTVPARRTMHIRFNALTNPEPIPPDTDYASVIESDVPIIVQHVRVDARQLENTLLTTLAWTE